MNVNLTPTELIYLFEKLLLTVANDAEQQEIKHHLTSKVKIALTECVEDLKSESNKEMLKDWLVSEEKKIDSLAKQNLEFSIKPLKTVSSKKKSKGKSKKKS